MGPPGASTTIRADRQPFGRFTTAQGLAWRKLGAEDWAANAELIGRAAQNARRIETVPVIERHDLRSRPTRVRPWETLRRLWRAGRQLRVSGLGRAGERSTP